MAQQQMVERKSAYRTTVGGILIFIGALMVIVGFVAWIMVGNQLKEQNMTVPGDASSNAGKTVAGPFTAWSLQEVIQIHADKITDGKSYAELGEVVNQAKEQYGEDSPEAAEAQGLRNTQMNASFLRASLFTSILATGVSVLTLGTGVSILLVGTVFVRRPTKPVTVEVSESVTQIED